MVSFSLGIRHPTDIKKSSNEIFNLLACNPCKKLEHGDAQQRSFFRTLRRQHQFVQRLAELVFQVKATTLSRPKKLQLLKEKLVLPRTDENGTTTSFAAFDPISLPPNPGRLVEGILPAKYEQIITQTKV